MSDRRYSVPLGLPDDEFDADVAMPGEGNNPYAMPGTEGQFQRSPIARRPEGLPPGARTAQAVMLGKPMEGVLPAPSELEFNEVPFTLAAGQSQQIAASDPYRTYFVIQNQNAVGGFDMRVAMGRIATSVSGLIVIAGGNYEPWKVPTNSISIFSASGASGIAYFASAGPMRRATRGGIAPRFR